MRKVVLRMNELFKYNTIKALVDNNGNKHRAAFKLNCSIRTINRLIIKYNKYGKSAFIHGNRGKSPSIAFSSDTKSKYVNLYINDFGDANLSHFCEIIYEDYGVNISSATISSWLKEHDILSPKAHRKTKKAMRQSLVSRLDISKSNKTKNSIKEAIATIDCSMAHPRRSRCKYMGEMIQMDASSFEWINNTTWHLHLAVDDASGTVVGAYFDTQETLKGYYNVFYQILTDYGIPAMFYTDRRTVFEYKRKNTAFDSDDTFTQFSYACNQLGVDIKTTSVAQAKGRIERLNETFQSRLPVELRRAHIDNIDEANQFLKCYLKKFNSQFALQLNSTKSVYEVQPSIDKINETLAIISNRIIDSGHCIRYKNKYYLPVTKDNDPAHFGRGTKCLVIEAFDNNTYVNVSDQLYCLREVPRHQSVSKEFDQPIKEKKKKHYIPPLNHPWRNASFSKFASKQKHRENNAYD